MLDSREEERVQSFWKENNIYRKVKEKNRGKEHFFFMDGPPTPRGGYTWVPLGTRS